MAKKFAWSYSALSAFETCPRQFHEMRVKKAWPDPPGEAQQFGTLCHSYLEDRFKLGRELPVFIQHLNPIVTKLETMPGQTEAEYKFALDDKLQPCEFKDWGRAWVRAVGDVVKLNGNAAFALDWKFGKYRDGDDQLKIQSAVMFSTFPQLEKIGVMYAWVKDRRTTVRQFTKEEVPIIWQEFLPRVKRMELAHQSGEYPPKPSGLCRKWCRVESCEFHGKGAY